MKALNNRDSKTERKRGRPPTMPKPWRDLVEAEGSKEKLAERLGATVSTLYRWINGEIAMRPLTRKELERIASEHGINIKL